MQQWAMSYRRLRPAATGGGTGPTIFSSFGRVRRKRARAFAQRNDGDGAGYYGAACQKVQSGRIAPSRVLDPADGIRAHEAAEVADRVDQRDAAGGRRAGEECRRQRPEGRLGAIDPDRRHRHGDHRPPRAVEESGPYQSDCGEIVGRRKVQSSLTGSIRGNAPQDHSHGSDRIGNRGDEAGAEIGQPQGFEHERHEERDAVSPGHRGEIDDGQHEHPRISQSPPQCKVAVLLRDGAPLVLQCRLQPLLFLCREPVRRCRPVGHEGQNGEGEQHRRHRFDDEEPLPASQAQNAVELQQSAGNRRRDRVRTRDRQKQRSDNAGAVFGGEPIGEIKDHAGEKPGFSNTEKKSEHQKADWAGDKRHRSRDQTPRNHDPRDPDTCAGLFQNDVARHFEKEVPEEEYPRAPAIHVGSEAEVFVHADGRETNICAIHVGDEVDHDDQRQKPPGHLGDRSLFKCAFHSRFLSLMLILLAGLPISDCRNPRSGRDARQLFLNHVLCMNPPLTSKKDGSSLGFRIIQAFGSFEWEINMFRVLTCLTGEHDWRLVILAGIVCFLASLAAISLFHRARATGGRTRAIWTVTAGAATGCGIWATHFIAKRAYYPGVRTPHDISLTALSLLAAAAVTSFGLAFAVYHPGRWRAAAGGGIVGAGVAFMHYTGMAALELPGHVTWIPGLVAWSVALGMIFGAAALAAAARSDDTRTTLLAALLLTLAIISHHFTAMGAVEIVPDPTRLIHSFSLAPTSLALAIAGAAVAVLGMSLVGALADRHIAHKAIEAAARFHGLAEATTEAIAICEGEVITDANSSLERLTGLSADAIVGKTIRELLDDSSAATPIGSQPVEILVKGPGGELIEW